MSQKSRGVNTFWRQCIYISCLLWISLCLCSPNVFRRLHIQRPLCTGVYLTVFEEKLTPVPSATSFAVSPLDCRPSHREQHILSYLTSLLVSLDFLPQPLLLWTPPVLCIFLRVLLKHEASLQSAIWSTLHQLRFWFVMWYFLSRSHDVHHTMTSLIILLYSCICCTFWLLA